MNSKNKIITIIILLTTTLTFTSCIFGNNDRDDYRGPHPELYTVAVHSLLGVRGVGQANGLHVADSTITIRGTDTYGRVMFYFSDDVSRGISDHNLVIMQKADDTHAYFYFLDNFITYPQEGQIVSFPLTSTRELQERNSWNTPLNPDNMTRVEIVRSKPDPRPVGDEDIIDAFMSIRDSDEPLRGQPSRIPSGIILFAIDNFGRSMHYMHFRYNTEHTVMLFLPDGSFDLETGFIGHLDPYNYRDQLKHFMELNRWNMPLD